MSNHKQHYKNSYYQLIINSIHPVETFKNIPEEIKGYILLGLPKNLKQKILRSLKTSEITNILKHLDADDIADIVYYVRPYRQKRVIGNLEKYLKDKTSELLKYSPETAGGLTSIDYILVYQKATFEQVRIKLKKHLKKFKNFPSVLVTNRGKLVGTLPIVDIFATDDKFIKGHIKQAKTVKHNADQEEILKIFDPNDRENIVVLDDDESILGIIKGRDLIKVAEQEATEDILSLAGVEKDENALDAVHIKVKSRIKWILLYLLSAFFSAWVISIFSTAIAKLAILAAFMPIVAGVGGNAGVQTLAVITRGIALNQISIKNSWQIVLKEIATAMINGLLVGIIVAIVAISFGETYIFGLIAGVAIILNILISGIFGTLIPITLKSLKIDPAVSSSSFLTATTDICGFFIFLFLAELFLI
ncbi:magnesium transporter [Candidatus Peregrinibacteria bacterium]|nr:magnesium transporter [Candidatus Peregrinibacteria bacterium]